MSHEALTGDRAMNTAALEWPVQPRPAFVASYVENGHRKLLPMSDRELQRGELFIRRVLSGDRWTPGRYALIISNLFDAAHVIALERVLTSNRLIVANCEASPYDGARIESTLRRFDVPVVFGVTPVVLDALKMVGFDAATLFKGRTVWASGEAWRTLKDAPGIDIRRFELIGPVFALEGRFGGGLHVDGREWHLEPEGDHTYVTSRLDRAATFKRLKINQPLAINPEPCASAATGPRILL